MFQKNNLLGAYYSAHETVGIKDIKQGIGICDKQTQHMLDYMDKYQIHCMIYQDIKTDRKNALLGEVQTDSLVEIPSLDKDKIDQDFLQNCHEEKIQRISGKPHILYMQGDITLLDKPILAIVGPRRMSEYAKRVLEKLFTMLTKYELITISGGADGVDTMVHMLSLEYNIPTIMVLGGGLGYHHTSTKWNMLQNIVDAGGLVTSEYKLFAKPMPYMFPHRNRLVAGLSDIVFLPEAATKSGSLITAHVAHTMKIPVYAPMQNIFYASSSGSNEAIENGSIIPLATLEKFLDKHFVRREGGGKGGEELVEGIFGKQKSSPEGEMKPMIYDSPGELIGESLSIEEYLVKDMERKLFG